MGRAKTPALVRIKDAIWELSDDERDGLAEWLGLVIEVRLEDKERKERKEAVPEQTPLKITS